MAGPQVKATKKGGGRFWVASFFSSSEALARVAIALGDVHGHRLRFVYAAPTIYMQKVNNVNNIFVRCEFSQYFLCWFFKWLKLTSENTGVHALPSYKCQEKHARYELEVCVWGVGIGLGTRCLVGQRHRGTDSVHALIWCWQAYRWTYVAVCGAMHGVVKYFVWLRKALETDQRSWTEVAIVNLSCRRWQHPTQSLNALREEREE